VHTLFKIPLAFFFVAACMGLFMRYQLIAPVQGINFTYVMHGHSHVMFLGWIFNMLYLAFVSEFVPDQRKFKTLFWILQVCVAGVLIAFPIQGYGLYAIAFTTLHTFLSFLFIALFLHATWNLSSLAILLARAALLFFILSSLGPFYLAYLKASGQAPSNFNRFAIYFYLHFQYNGFFFFGVLSLLTKAVESQLSDTDLRRATRGAKLLIISCFPAYFLSILWAEPGKIFNIISFTFALAQVLALLSFVKPFRLYLIKAREQHTRWLLKFSFVALFIKCTLQVFSAHPVIAQMASEFRSILIAYLHLALLGFISFFLIGWLEMKSGVTVNLRKSAILVFLGFIGSEALLVIIPWANVFPNIDIMFIQQCIFLFSTLLVFGIGGLSFSLKKGLSYNT